MGWKKTHIELPSPYPIWRGTAEHGGFVIQRVASDYYQVNLAPLPSRFRYSVLRVDDGGSYAGYEPPEGAALTLYGAKHLANQLWQLELDRKLQLDTPLSLWADGTIESTATYNRIRRGSVGWKCYSGDDTEAEWLSLTEDCGRASGLFEMNAFEARGEVCWEVAWYFLTGERLGRRERKASPPSRPSTPPKSTVTWGVLK